MTLMGDPMEMVTVAELGRRPSATLSSKEPSIVTNNGHAQNLIVNVEGMGIDRVVDMARRMQGMAALEALRADAASRGLDRMTDTEINAEIQAERASR